MLNIKKIKPMFNALVTTMDRYEEDIKIGALIDTSKAKGTIKEYLRVLAVGTTVRDIKVGDLVNINPIRFAVKKHREGSLKDGIISDNPVVAYNFDIIELDGKECLLLQDRDINFIIEEYDEVPDNTSTTLIMPEEKKIIL